MGKRFKIFCGLMQFCKSFMSLIDHCFRFDAFSNVKRLLQVFCSFIQTLFVKKYFSKLQQ